MIKQNQWNLGGSLKDILEGIRTSYEERMQYLHHQIAQTHEILNRFRKDHAEMAKELKRSLKNFNTARIDDFQQFFMNLSKENAQAAKEIKQFLKKYDITRVSDFHKFFSKLENGNAKAAKEIKSFLKKSNLDRLEKFSEFFTPIKSEIKWLRDVYKGFPEQMSRLRQKQAGIYLRSLPSSRHMLPTPSSVKPGEFKVNRNHKKRKAT